VFYYVSLPLVLVAVLGGGGALIYGFFMLGQIPIKLVLLIALGAMVTFYAVLRGMFVRAGLRDVQQLVKSFDFNHTEFMQMFFVHERIAAAAAAGEITAQEGKEFLAAIEERHRAGTFYGSAIGYTVAGTMP
jgi:hypothetical protein